MSNKKYTVYHSGHGLHDVINPDNTEFVNELELWQANKIADTFNANAELLLATQKLSNGKIVPSDEVLIEFLDWFGTWQTDKNLDDYGINDVLDSFKTSLIAKHSK